MLIFIGALLGVLSSLWYSFFGMLAVDGAEGRSLAIFAAVLLGSLVILCPAAYWLYARVTGQEMVEPSVRSSKARTVFLTLWMICAVITLVSVIASTASNVISSIFSLGETNGIELWVGNFISSIFAVATLVLGIAMVVKRVSRAAVLKGAYIVAGLSLILVVANVVMISMRKDYNRPSVVCSLSSYYDGDCTYTEYLRENKSSSLYNDSSSRPSNPFEFN